MPAEWTLNKPDAEIRVFTMPLTEAELQHARETIVTAFYHQTKHDLPASEQFDALVCRVLKIDADEAPPEFLADEYLLGG